MRSKPARISEATRSKRCRISLRSSAVSARSIFFEELVDEMGFEKNRPSQDQQVTKNTSGQIRRNRDSRN